MARWFVMDRRVASELKKNYFFICCRSRLLPNFLFAYRRDSPFINS